MSNNEKSMRTRKDPDVRKSDILAAALVEAAESGFETISRQGIARRAGVSDSLVNKYMGNLKKVRITVMQLAVKHEHLTIIAQGIVTRNPYALKASDELQARALASFNKV